MRILTWNINSVRLRMPSLAQLAVQENPDVICLQETKTPDEHFPLSAIQDAGYPHVFFKGMKGYNGVAILSKYPLVNTDVYQRCGKDDCRHISAAIQVNGLDQPVEIHNLYIPAGGYEPDPIGNEKFQHKLDFVDELSDWFSKKRDNNTPMVAVGDMNIAPLENDVWSHKQMVNVVSHTPVEIEKFVNFQKSVDWVDAVRTFVPEEEKLYSWWSYRSPNWEKSDRGRRLDHMWVTQPLKETLSGQKILKEVRGWERPSDHAPVSLDLKLTI